MTNEELTKAIVEGNVNITRASVVDGWLDFSVFCDFGCNCGGGFSKEDIIVIAEAMGMTVTEKIKLKKFPAKGQRRLCI